MRLLGNCYWATKDHLAKIKTTDKPYLCSRVLRGTFRAVAAKSSVSNALSKPAFSASTEPDCSAKLSFSVRLNY